MSHGVATPDTTAVEEVSVHVEDVLQALASAGVRP